MTPFKSVHLILKPYDFEIRFFHTEDNRGTHMYLLQKVQMLTHAPEGNTINEEQGV